MCRSIKRLRDGSEPAPPEEVKAAALQYVRKISGFAKPTDHNAEVFRETVVDIAEASQRLLEHLEIRGTTSKVS